MHKDVDEADHLGQTALILAAQCNWLSGAMELLEMRANVNLVTAQKKHALHFAASHGDIVHKCNTATLVENGA